MLLLHWSPVTISETRQGCDQDPVPCADLQPSSHPGASPCLHAHLVSLCPGCSIKLHSESLSETQPFQVLHTMRSPSLETWRNCSPHRARCSWEHPLHCFVPHFFSICVAFCAWIPTIYSVEGKAAFQEGSLKKLFDLFGFAFMGSTNVIEEMKPLRITKFWVCLEFSEDLMPDPSRLTLALLYCSLQRCVD